MEMPVESEGGHPPGTAPALRIRLLGTLAIARAGVPLPLPASRKVRALLGYLALAPRPVPRSQLCDLFWDVPNDPRGELRWCLSKIRALIDEPGRPRVQAQEDAVALDLSDAAVDFTALGKACEGGIARLSAGELGRLAGLFEGEVLDGLEIERSPAFEAWLTAQRRRARAWHAALLERLVAVAEDEAVAGHLDRLLALCPFDVTTHAKLLQRLARLGQLREGEQHLAAAIRLFQAEGLDCEKLREAWRSARASANPAPPRPGSVTAQAAPAPGPEQAQAAPATRRASLAVMPFEDLSNPGSPHHGAAGALAHDIITRLAKLRSLFIIAQGSVFALHERQVGPEEAGRILNVDYVVGGSLRHDGRRLTVTVELTETRDARIVWAESFSHTLDDAFLVLDEIGDRIVASIASEIETSERNRAILRPPNSLNAWEAHHRGLWHMYRFTKADNALAQHFFETAVRLDPTFARAYAGLSFAHFQNAFQGWERRDAETDRAFAAASQSLMVDDRDPAAHWAMGRALWLRGQHDPSIGELEQAVALSPNFAQGHYALAFVHSQAGDPGTAIAASDHSRELSPFDPMLFAMLGARAMALVRLGDFEQAACWGVRAASRPNAHVQIRAIAALTLALAGRHEEARNYLAAIRQSAPGYRLRDFLTAMHFAPEGERLFREGARLVGLG